MRTHAAEEKVVMHNYKGNKGRCKELTLRGHRKKSEPQMGFVPTTLLSVSSYG